MSVFGSLFTAVSGLTAQSDAISMISNNIANVSTIGYKEVDASFESLVTTQSGSTSYSPGSVISQQTQTINQQGILQQTSSPTDVAISGNGFFVVKASTTNALAAPLYTRAGSFTENADGDLVNTAGYYLQGWPLDQDGNPPAGQANISSLVPVNVSDLGGLTEPTSKAAISLNLDSSANPVAYPVPSGTTPSYSTAVQVYDFLGTGNNLNVNFTKMTSPTASITGTTSLADVTGDVGGTIGTTTSTDSFSIQVNNSSGTAINTPAATITLDGTVAEMLAQINAIVNPVTNTPLVTAQLNSDGDLSITADNIGDTLTLADVTGTPLGPTGVGLGLSQQFQSQALGDMDLNTAIGTTPLDQVGGGGVFNDNDSFTIQAGTNPAVTITIGDPAITGDPTSVNTLTSMIAAMNVPDSGFTASIDSATGFLDIQTTTGLPLTLTDPNGTLGGTADGGTAGDANSGLGMFNALTAQTNNLVVPGSLTPTGLIPAPSQSPTLLTPLGSTTPDADGWWNVTYTTPAGAVVGSGAINFLGNGELNATPNASGAVPVNLTNINWGDGSNAQDITFNMAGFTQFASDYDVVSSTQNGAALGLQTGISINSSGYVVAQFSNGQSQNIYQLPIATFSNPDGLNSSTGNVYTQTDNSGTYNLRVSGTGGAGTIASGELEASNVDLATQFAKMIVTQQAYSANSKVITTADQMMQDLLQINS